MSSTFPAAGITTAPAYRWVRALDRMPALYATDGLGDAAIARVKLFDPTGGLTWYLTELDHEGTAFGLVTGGQGDELGYIDLNELWAVRGRLGLRMERDIHFARRTLAECRSGGQS